VAAEASENCREEVILAAGGLLWRDSPRGKQLAIVHRHRYGDWTLPKGKLEHDESRTSAAQRGVCEETGCTVRLEGFAGSISYSVDERPKVVLFWHMSVLEECARDVSREVADVGWLSAVDARCQLLSLG
jgi:8-oxo-(d)GTP phosphatase